MIARNRMMGIALVVSALFLLGLLVTLKHHNDQQETFLCQIVENDPDLKMEDCPAHTSNTSWLIAIAFGFTFLLLGVGVYFLLPPPVPIPPGKGVHEPLQKGFKAIDLSKLDDEEKAVYEMVKAAGGSSYQGDLVRESDFSKVKITRILDRLEMKGVVERHRRGMTNIIVLK